MPCSFLASTRKMSSNAYLLKQVFTLMKKTADKFTFMLLKKICFRFNPSIFIAFRTLLYQKI